MEESLFGRWRRAPLEGGGGRSWEAQLLIQAWVMESIVLPFLKEFRAILATRLTATAGITASAGP